MMIAALAKKTVLLLVAISVTTVAEEQGTLMCYGNRFKIVIGAPKIATEVTFDCPGCIQTQLCPQGLDICFLLTTKYVHIFKGGSVSQPPIQLHQDCQPLRIVEFDPEHEYIVQCASTPTLFRPTRQHIYRRDQESNFIIDRGIEQVESVDDDDTFAPVPDNNALIIDQVPYVASFLAESNVILIDFGDYRAVITECRIITKLTTGPVVDRNLQLIVDCIDTDGSLARKRVLIADNFRTLPSVQSLHPPLANDTVTFSPDGSYLLYTSISQLTIVQVNELSGVPGIMHLNGPIAQAIFIGNTILLSIPGQNRVKIDIPRFFSTSFEGGRDVLPESEAICPQGKCPPIVYSNDTVYLFSADPLSPSYQVLSSYDFNNPSAGPKRISKVLKTAIYDVCFPVTADIPVLNTSTPTQHPPTPPPTPPPTHPPTHPHTHPPTHPPDPPPTLELDGIKPSHSRILTQEQTAGIISGVVAFIIITVTIFIGLCCYFYCVRTGIFLKKNIDKQSIAQETTIPQINISPAKSNMYYPQLSPPTGSATTSAYPSSAPSLEFLDTTTQQSVPETTAKHHSIPLQQVLNSGATKLAQMVLEQ